MTENNVVVFGESGAGKSSLVNVLLGEEVAHVSDSAVGCTFEHEKYATENYTIFDTVGLSEGSKGTMKSSTALNQLINLLKSLKNGVSLLIFVMEKGRIRKSLDENYKLFADAICMKKVPVILVITHCEMETRQGKWWEENKQHFDNYGMTFSAVISGCCMNPDQAPPVVNREVIRTLNETTITQLKEAIQAHMLVPGWKVKGSWIDWFRNIIIKVWRIICSFLGITWNGAEETDLQSRIENYLVYIGYEAAAARQIAYDIANGV